MPREGSGSLSMQSVGCIPWCSTEAGVSSIILSICFVNQIDGCDRIRVVAATFVARKIYSSNVHHLYAILI